MNLRHYGRRLVGADEIGLRLRENYGNRHVQTSPVVVRIERMILSPSAEKIVVNFIAWIL